MKTIVIIFAAVLLACTFQLSTVSAQAPEKMTYQAVVRNATNQLLTNQGIGMQISILQTTTTGTAIYVETHNTTTNTNGLVTVEIGTGNIESGDFSTIDWANDTYFIKTETDPSTAGGTAYTITGTSQLMSVPYALHAKTAESIEGGITETDPVFTGSEASSITATDITNLSNLSGTNTGNQNITGIATNKQAIKDTASQIRADFPNVSGFVSTETDPTFTTWDKSTGISLTESQISDLTHTIDTDTHIDSTGIANLGYVAGVADGSETKLSAGTNVTVTGTGTTASPYMINAEKGAEKLNDLTDVIVDEGSLFIGELSGMNDDGSNHNTAIGKRAMHGNISGHENVSVGYRAMNQNTSGRGNVSAGYQAMHENTSGQGNVSVGFNAMYFNNTGNDNVAIGEFGGYQNEGDGNVFIGHGAGRNALIGSGNVFIGNEAGQNEWGSNKLYISNSSTSEPLIYGEFDTKIVEMPNVNIKEVLHLTPQYTEPSNPEIGMLYVSTDGHIYCYLDAVWVQLDN